MCDVTKRDKVYSVAQRVKDEVGHVTILVNNAGIAIGKRMLDCPDHMIEKTFQVNTISHFWTCKCFLPYMIARNHGHIVTVSSIAGMIGSPNLVDYCASKHAAVGFHASLFLELRKEQHDGIKMTLICPSLVNTSMFAGGSVGYVAPLEADYVAGEIVSSVLTNEEILMLPRLTSGFAALQYILPIRASLALCEALKGDRMVDNFTGRPSKNE